MSNGFRESVTNALARALARPDSSSVRAPQTAQLSMHQVTIQVVDSATNTVHVTFNGATDVTPGIRVAEAYTPNNPPSAGDTAVGHHNGTDFFVWGRLVTPNSTVTP